MQSLAEWRLGRVTSETKKNKQRVNLEPPRPMAARLKKKKKQRVNLEPPRPMAARLKKKKQRVNLEPRRPMAARLKKTTCKLRTASAYGRAVNK